ncbi:hypothetical protein [Rhodococcus sp. PSBB049]|uniref:hypothetical protein n=1 Tax=Rhodococcus sp. PSBB049 TaxID=2812863 RepID=UPI00197F5908|nr:hypothetical protein [Rhodococcus sp. PSBB049]QSE72192.1 hypothetical protein JYA91_27865 [Rhodococcus sp. PSBB049]
MTSPHPILTPYGPRYVGVVGWRINMVNTHGEITGIPTGDAYTPHAICRKNPKHSGAVLDCTCGHRVVTNLDRVVLYIDSSDYYISAIGYGGMRWGGYMDKLIPDYYDYDDSDQSAHRILLHVASVDPHEEPRPPSWDDPRDTHRVSRLIVLHGYLRQQDAHLAPQVRDLYPFPVTVLDNDDFRTAGQTTS